jgi:hypothetical protein
VREKDGEKGATGESREKRGGEWRGGVLGEADASIIS